MLKETSGYPIPYHPTWEIIDSTKLQDAQQCWRMFFFKYILGWDKEEPNNHLIFGQAWHDGQEHLLLNGYDENSIMGAYEALRSTYRRTFPEPTDELYYPKVPGRALEALVSYVVKWGEHDAQQKVLMTEIAGTVPIMEGVVMHLRLDSLIQVGDKVRSREHKTGSRLDRVWRSKWTLKTQVGTYHHALNCLYPPEAVEGIEINGAIFNKSKTEFERIPIRKTPAFMESWWWDTKWWVSHLLAEYEALHSCRVGDPILRAFPKCGESCTMYFGCPYMDFCSAWPNPLQYAEEPPIGMTTRWWNPMEDSWKPKNIIELPAME